MFSRTDSLRQAGQATIEAAFMLPLLFAMFALLLQPAILLYDRCVMNAAASEACRLASTAQVTDATVRSFVFRRLEALPKLDIFHSQSCEFAVEIDGGSRAEEATVVIEAHVKTLPLLSMTASTLTQQAGDGCALLHAESTAVLHPSWLSHADGEPNDWVEQWD